jgi:hypothetical protein
VAEEELPPGDRRSSLRLDFQVSIGYTRLRPGEGVEDTWEAHVGTVGLLVAGAVIAVLIIWIALPRILDWVTHLAGST